MAIHAQTSCTLSTITDVEAVYTYYYLSDSTITVNEAPKDGINTPGAQTITVISDGESYIWQLTEPELDIEDNIIQSAVGKLYYIECVKFSDGTYDWGPLMTSSTYAAAKAAYNLSYQAIQQAQAANEATALLGGHFLYNSTWQTLNTPHSANVVQTVVDNGIDVSDDPAKWGYNTHIGANGIRLRYNETTLSEWKTNSLTFFKPNTTYPALSLTGNAITFYNPSSNVTQLIIGANGALQSGGYTRGSDSKFSSNGTKIDLINGDIITKYFRLSQGLEQGLTAGAYIYGTIEALDGTIGTDSTNYWEIGNSTDYNLHDTAKIVGHGSSYIQLGDSSTWRLSTNRIHTGWYTNSDTLLHYPQIDSKYWDFGIHIPNSDNPSGRGSDKFLYIRSSKANTSATNVLKNLLYDIDDNYETAYWDYKFWVDKDGKVHAPGFYIGNSTIPIGGGAGTIAEKLLTGAGDAAQPVYFRSDEGHVGEVATTTYALNAAGAKGVITDFTNNITSTDLPTTAAVVNYITNQGYITSYTETDPTVPAWAKASTKPSYSYSEINGTVPQSALPSYVDDVLEYNNYNSFPSIGESGKIYISANDNKTYRWSGSQYVEISSSLALGETESTAYRGDRGKIAYEHATDLNRLTTSTNSGFYKFSVTSEGHIGSVSIVTASDIPTLTKSKISDFPTTWALNNITGADDLKVIEALSGTRGFLKKTGANTWTLDTNTYLTEHQDISGKADKSSTITNVAYDSTNKKITKTIDGTTTDVVTIATLKTALNLTKTDVGLGNVTNDAQIPKSIFDGAYQLLYSTTASVLSKLAPNTTNTKKFLRMTGTGSAGAAPAWDTVSKSDVGLGNVVNYAQVTKIGQGENGKLRVWTGTNPSSTSSSDYKDIEIAITAYEQSTVTAAEQATNDADGDDIRATYGHSISINGHTISLKDKNGNPLGSTVTVPDNNTTYTFEDGINSFKVTPSGGTVQTVTVTPSITNNITGSGTSNYLVKFNGANTITNGPKITSGGTGFLKEDGTWATPTGTYSLSIAAYNTLGGLKPWYSTTGASTLASGSAGSNSSTPLINTRSTTTGRYYAIEIDKNGRLFVNVPWSDTTYTIPTQTNNSTTGLTIANHSTTTIYGVSSSTTSVTGVSGSTSVRGVKTDSTVTASKASGANGSASNWTFESKTVTKNPSFTYDALNTSLIISFGTETIYSKSGGNNGTAPTWSFTDVTVPIRADSNTTVPIAAANATTVPIKNTSNTTVVINGTHSITDPGHTHTIS